MSRSKLCELTLDDLAEDCRVIVAGDIHGDYEGFRRICGLFDPVRDFLMFLGDYADRGPMGVEVVEGVMELVGSYPGRVIALKGNHEDYTVDGRPKFMPCDLMFEAEERRGGWEMYFKDELKPFIEELFLAVLVPGEALFVHGGVSSKVEDVDDLRLPSPSVEEDVLWSDPFEGFGEHLNTRGAGVEFGEDVSEETCRRLGVKRIVRSHQPTKALEGPYVEHGGRVITISSTIVYGGTPFVLVLLPKNSDTAFRRLEGYTVILR